MFFIRGLYWVVYKLDSVPNNLFVNNQIAMATAIYLCDVPAESTKTGNSYSAYFVLLRVGFALKFIAEIQRALLPHGFTLTT